MPNYSIPQEKIDDLFGRGYTGLPNPLEPKLLKRLQDMAEKFEKSVMERDNKGEQVPDAAILNHEDPFGKMLSRYNNVHQKDTDTILDLLASPPMMAIFRDICGRGAVPLMSDIIYKQSHPKHTVLWHQDATHTRTHPFLNVGIYLDNADVDDGCVCFVPNTQHEIQDIQTLVEEHGWEIPGVVDCPAKEGDINIHDVMILHGSKTKKTSGVRRTIYVEIRVDEGIAHSKANSDQWIELRKRFMGLVLRRADPNDWPEEWKEDYPSDLKSDEEEIAAIMDKWEAPVPAIYAPLPIEHPEYPIPSGLRK